MLHTLHGLLAPAFAQRLTLALNHVLGAEKAAVERLQAHSGRVLKLELTGWPSAFPMPVPAPEPLGRLPKAARRRSSKPGKRGERK